MPSQVSNGINLRSKRFFRKRLLTLSVDQIVEYSEALDKEAKLIKKEALKNVWYMRGGLSFAEAMNLSADERSIVSEIVNDNLETTKKTNLPFF